MLQVLNLSLPRPILGLSTTVPDESTRSGLPVTRYRTANQNWVSLQSKLKCSGRFSCLFSDNRREEQAKRALESALGEKKNEFEKWNNEIKKREEVGGGGSGGGGRGWFGSGGWFGWSDDRFWPEAQQTSLTVLGIIVMYLIVAKGEVLLAVIFNPLLYALRGTRNGLTFVTSKILGSTSSGGDEISNSNGEASGHVSAKERVARKWGGE